MKISIKLLFFIGVAFILNSCVKNNEDPSWIEITEWQLIKNPNEQYPSGVLTSNLTNAWVYVNNKIIGVFELPCKIPVLESGTVEIKVFPAILNNGISATKKIYPFMEPVTISANLIQNEVFHIDPVTQYYAQTKFTFENFEDPTIKLEDGPTSLANLQVVSDANIIDPTINGTKFCKIVLSDAANNWIASTTFNNGALNMPLPSGKEVYLEIDYYNTNRFTSGLLGISQNGIQDNPNVQMNPQDPNSVRWKKIYIELREVVSGMTTADYFEFSFQALIDDGETDGIICIDNIKAVYF